VDPNPIRQQTARSKSAGIVRTRLLVMLVIVGLSCALSCAQEDDKESDYRGWVSCGLHFHPDHYMQSLDSVLGLVLPSVDDAHILAALKKNVRQWFDMSEVERFWTQCDSAIGIEDVLCTCEAGSEDNPGYYCMALVRTKEGLAVVGTEISTLLHAKSGRPDVETLSSERAREAISNLKRWRHGLSVGLGTDPWSLTSDIYLVRACIDGELVAYATSYPSVSCDRAFDSLYSYLRVLLGRSELRRIELKRR